MRRGHEELVRDALADLVRTLDTLGVASKMRAGDDERIVIDTASVAVEVKSVVADDGGRLARSLSRRSSPVIVVADRIARTAQDQLRRAGVSFFDRRGHLRLWLPPRLRIDAAVPGLGEPARGAVLSSQVAKEAAIAVLLEPNRPHGVREIATFVERAPSAVSVALADLRFVGLVTDRNEAIAPALFRAVAAVWQPRRVSLAEMPPPARARLTDQLGLGLDDPEGAPGWALTDTLAAVSWGMPVVARGDHPPDFYVPSVALAARAEALLGRAERDADRACTVAVAPVRLVCLHRVDRARQSGEMWPVANHIVVALDLAQDPARGAEILERWQPVGIDRAW